jgi:subtilisin family serine protease
LENCLQFLLAPTRLDGSVANPDKRPDIINHSYGVPNSLALERAYTALHESGVMNIAAIGNSGVCGYSTAPGIYKDVLTGNLSSF